MSCQIWQRVELYGLQNDNNGNTILIEFLCDEHTTKRMYVRIMKMMKKTLSKRGRVKIATERW